VTDADGDTVNPFDNPIAKAQPLCARRWSRIPRAWRWTVPAIFTSRIATRANHYGSAGRAGLTLKDGLDSPGPIQIDPKGRSFIFGEAGGKVMRTFLWDFGRGDGHDRTLIVGAKVFLETPAGTLPGASSTVNRYLTQNDGKFTVLGLLAPEMASIRQSVVTIEYQGKTQAFPVTLARSARRSPISI